MKKLPRFKFYAPKEAELKKLEKWIELWELKKSINSSFSFMNEKTIEISKEENEKIGELFKSTVRPFDAIPKVGEIRHLPPNMFEGVSAPRYVAIIRKWDDENYLAAPFSDIPVAAVQGELETGREDFSLANLELWNAIIAPFVTLKKSWIVDTLSESETEDAFSVFKFISSGEELPEHLKERVGPPILLNNDPRVEYQDEETLHFSLFREICQENMYPFFQSISSKVLKKVHYLPVPKTPEERVAEPAQGYPLEFIAAAGEASKADCSIPVEIVLDGEKREINVVFEWNNSEKVTEVSLEGGIVSKLYKDNVKLNVIFENGDEISHRFDFEKNSVLKIPLKNIPISGIELYL
ncbi:MAG: hypothetical protein ACOX2F_02830 [bacterium]